MEGKQRQQAEQWQTKEVNGKEAIVRDRTEREAKKWQTEDQKGRGDMSSC
jgi:hypothetical protein